LRILSRALQGKNRITSRYRTASVTAKLRLMRHPAPHFAMRGKRAFTLNVHGLDWLQMGVPPETAGTASANRRHSIMSIPA
jgi:hypothetical protein